MAKRKTPYPIHPDSVRPFRFWDSLTNKQMKYRYYGLIRSAHLGILWELKLAKPGQVFQLIDVRNGRLLGEYKRTLDSIKFIKG